MLYRVEYWMNGKGTVGSRDFSRVSYAYRAVKICQRMADLFKTECSFRVYRYTSNEPVCLASGGSIMFFQTEPSVRDNALPS